MTLRVLLHGFTNSPAAANAAHEIVSSTSGIEFAGWVARPRFRPLLSDAWFGPGRRRYDEPLPSSPEWTVPLRTDSRLGLGGTLVDENLRYLLDRERHFDNQYDVTQLRSEVLCYAQEILDDANANALILSDVPHSVLSYALYIAARERTMQTLFLRTGPAPHLFGFCEMLGQTLFTFARAGRVSDGPTSGLAARFVERLGDEYAVAVPESMKRQLRGSTLTSRAATVLKERPQELASREGWRKARANLQRQRLRAAYEQLARDGDLPEQFVVLFLHLQPERSTTPEGGPWAQQWLVAHAIASALPPDWRLLVREHPSTFLTGPRLVRSRESYESLLRIPHVELVSAGMDPFTLIDSARCVATVTGTVGLEAIARGRPTLVFGDATYLGCPGAIQISRADDIAPALVRVIGDPAPGPGELIAYLDAMERSERIYTSVDHVDDAQKALDTGIAYRGVIPQMLRYLVDSARSATST